MMNRFEELEYLADFIPEEGEAIVVARRDGELVCEPMRSDPRLADEDGIAIDPALYGRLVQANERLTAVATWPIFVTVTLWFWSCVAVHLLTGLGWNAWYLDIGLALVAGAVAHAWIQHRQWRLFRTELQPVVTRLLDERGLDRFTVIGAMRHRPELRTLLADMARWSD